MVSLPQEEVTLLSRKEHHWIHCLRTLSYRLWLGFSNASQFIGYLDKGVYDVHSELMLNFFCISISNPEINFFGVIYPYLSDI